MNEHDGADVTVLLLPGLWMPAWVMIPLQQRIARCGFRTLRVGYASVRAGLQQNAQFLARCIEQSGSARVHLVGHSLGGVLALHATASLALHRVQRIVMIGSPYRDSHAARRLARLRLGRSMLGQCVPQWLACAKPLVPAQVEVGVIVGTAAFGLGALLAPDLPRPHDGVVSVEETSVPGMKAVVHVRVSHSYMLVSAKVGRLTCRFLRSGDFESDVERSPERSA
jgi:pimeloyl-ACP methyl ester carboxylesterase